MAGAALLVGATSACQSMMTRYSQDDLPWLWGWLAAGVILFLVTQFACGLLKK
jgi:hypothetical protein